MAPASLERRPVGRQRGALGRHGVDPHRPGTALDAPRDVAHGVCAERVEGHGERGTVPTRAPHHCTKPRGGRMTSPRPRKRGAGLRGLRCRLERCSLRGFEPRLARSGGRSVDTRAEELRSKRWGESEARPSSCGPWDDALRRTTWVTRRMIDRRRRDAAVAHAPGNASGARIARESVWEVARSRATKRGARRCER